MTSSHGRVLARLLTKGSPKVGIIGQGLIGTITSQLVCDSGLTAIGYDSDAKRVPELNSRRRPSRMSRVVADFSLLADVDVLVVAISMPISPDGTLVRTSLRSLAGQLGALPKRNRLIVVETTLPPGTTRWFAAQLLGTPQDGSAHVAYCPERLRAGESIDEVRSTPRLVGGLTNDATVLACKFLKRIRVRPVPVSSPEVAELSKLLENAFLTTGICLMGEITRLAHAIGVTAAEVASAAATKPHRYLPFFPGAGIGGHCLPNDLRLLQQTAKTLRVDTPLLKSLSTSSAELSPAVLRHLETLMRAHGRAMSRSRVWVIGIGFKVGSSDTRDTPAIGLIRMLRQRKAIALYSDPTVDSFIVDNKSVQRVAKHAWPTNIDAALILSGDPGVQLSELSRRVPVVLDLGGARIMSGSHSGIATL